MFIILLIKNATNTKGIHDCITTTTQAAIYLQHETKCKYAPSRCAPTLTPNSRILISSSVYFIILTQCCLRYQSAEEHMNE